MKTRLKATKTDKSRLKTDKGIRRSVKHGRRERRIRWTMELAGKEFGIDLRVLKKRLATAGIMPGPDRYYATQQICAAVYGDIQGERLRKTREEADKLAIANAKERGSLVETRLIVALIAKFAQAIKNKIESSPLPIEDKRDILTDLRDLRESDYTTTVTD